MVKRRSSSEDRKGSVVVGEKWPLVLAVDTPYLG